MLRTRLLLAVAPSLLLPLAACSPPSFPYGPFISDSDSDEMELRTDGTFTYSERGEVVTEGTFAVEGNQLTWLTDTFCDANDAGPATYIWTFKQETLRLQVKGEDPCSDRLFVLNEASFHPRPDVP